MAWVEFGRDRVHAAGWGRVCAVDLPGFGLSPLGDRRADLAGNVDVLTDIIAAVSPGRPVVLTGNSMGGLLATIRAVGRCAPGSPWAPTRSGERWPRCAHPPC